MNRPTANRRVMSLILLLAMTWVAGCAFGQTALIPPGANWKYLDDGSNQDSSWRESTFDDSSWPEGRAQLGYGDRDETTVVSFGPDRHKKNITTYFRHSFDVSSPLQYRGLKLRLLRDDGAIVYLNGAEMARSNMPSRKIDYVTRASSNVTGSGEDTFYEFFVAPERLVPGTNVLAVEIHQSSPTSSDISFDLELVATGAMRKAPYLLYMGDNTQMNIMWQLNSSVTCTIDWGLDTLYSLGRQQTSEFGNDHQHAYVLRNLIPSTKYYYRVAVDTNTFVGSFRAAPAPSAGNVNLMVYGDSRSYPADHERVARAIVATYVADSSFQSLVVSVGDLVNNGDEESDWDTELFDSGYPHIPEMLACVPYEVAMGNHERSGVLFSKYFPYPFVGGRYWSFDYGPAHFVMVDQYTDCGAGSEQLAWVQKDLAATSKPWKFICLHEPGWSAGGHPNNVVVRNYLQPLCETYGVAILFAGHNHYYARADVNGVEHVTTGGGGAPLSPPDVTCPHVVTGTWGLHYCKVEIHGDLLRFTALTPGGRVIDEFTLNRTARNPEPGKE